MTIRKKDKRTNNDLQKITKKVKDRAMRALLKPRVNTCVSEGLATSAPIVLLLNPFAATFRV